MVLGYSQDAGGRRWNRLALPERAALQLLGHPTLEASAGLIGHRPDWGLSSNRAGSSAKHLEVVPLPSAGAIGR